MTMIIMTMVMMIQPRIGLLVLVSIGVSPLVVVDNALQEAA
jgi:hypothetical protein